MTGIPARTFWLSHFLFDLFLYGIYTISVLAIYFVWDRVVNDRRIYFANFEHSGEFDALMHQLMWNPRGIMQKLTALLPFSITKQWH